MCYGNDARPPDVPGASGKANGKDIELVSADGTRFAAYAAHSGGQEVRSQAVIFPDVRGLHQFYKELAMRFAEKGIDAVAIDYFGRTAGISSRDDSFDFMTHVQQMQWPSFLADVRAALDYLRGITSDCSTFVVGFCMGGGLALHVGTENLGVAGIIAFYAGMSRKFAGSERTALEKAVEMRVPVLGLFGGADQGIPASDVHKLDEELDSAGVEHKIIIYPGAPHSFFDRKATDFAAASSDAWAQALGFIAAHSE
ncbi:MAG: dienelactone hydrolase family protein [Chloroflexi bacterium]|nr:dienelactone hydrolase family protein [Chloroflexota bacterium]